MIKSRYFPDAARCLAEVPSNGDKIEIPADVYDSLADDDKKNYILRGAYPYEAVKIIAQSNLVKAVELDTASGKHSRNQCGIGIRLRHLEFLRRRVGD